MYCPECGGLVVNRKCEDCKTEISEELLAYAEEEIENPTDKIAFILAYSFWPAAKLSKAENKELLKFHLNQGFLVFILEILTIISTFVPQVGLWLFIALFGLTSYLIYKGITNVLKKEKEKLPIVGDFVFFK